MAPSACTFPAERKLKKATPGRVLAIPRMGETTNPPVREDEPCSIRDSERMEALITPLESLMWVLTPAGAVFAFVLFGLLASGLVGRVFPNLEVSGSAGRTTSRNRALDAETQRERIMK